jgi:hypothetical protein
MAADLVARPQVRRDDGPQWFRYHFVRRHPETIVRGHRAFGVSATRSTISWTKRSLSTAGGQSTKG